MRKQELTCIVCPTGCTITVTVEDGKDLTITGYRCPRGKEYARSEALCPTRILTTTVRVKNGQLPLLPVRTRDPIPKSALLPAMKELARVTLQAPVAAGQIVRKNILDTGVDVIASRSLPERVSESFAPFRKEGILD